MKILKILAVVAGVLSVPTYFFLFSYPLVRALLEFDALAWAFIPPAIVPFLAIIMLMVCSGLGYLTYLLIRFGLRPLVDGIPDTILDHERDTL
jgi:hypothetical protein